MQPRLVQGVRRFTCEWSHCAAEDTFLEPNAGTLAEATEMSVQEPGSINMDKAFEALG